MDKQRNNVMLEYVLRNVACRRIVVYVVFLVIYWYVCQNRWREAIDHTMSLERDKIRDEIMRQLVGYERSQNIIRMGPKAFLNLCAMLERHSVVFQLFHVGLLEVYLSLLCFCLRNLDCARWSVFKTFFDSCG